MAEPAENALTAALAAGDQAAFAAVYDRFAPALFRTAVVLLGSPADAEDAVQDVFVGLARARHDLARVASLRAYLFAALRHAAARRAAARRRHRAEPLGDAPGPAAPAADDRGERVERAVRALPPEQREVLALKLDGGLTFAEVAAALGVSPNTAASRYRYALDRLRAHYREEHHDPRPAADPR